MLSEGVLSGFKFHKNLGAPGVGEVDVLRSEKGEVLLRKRLGKYASFGPQIIDNFSRLQCQGFQQLLGISGRDGEQLFLEFSRKSLEDHLRICQERDLVVSEADLRGLLGVLVECGLAMERAGEFHPALTLQNIFRLKESFKLISPFVFDAYIEETLYSPKRPTSLSRQEKRRVNLVQSGVAILAMGLLQPEAEIKRVVRAGDLPVLLRLFQERYSAHFGQVIADLVGGKVITFEELSRRVPSSGREENRERFAISPPLDLEGDFLSTLPARPKIGERESPIKFSPAKPVAEQNNDYSKDFTYPRENLHERHWDRENTRPRDKEEYRDNEKDRRRELYRDRDKGIQINTEKELEIEKERKYDRIKDRERELDREKQREQEVAREREKDRERERERLFYKSRDLMNTPVGGRVKGRPLDYMTGQGPINEEYTSQARLRASPSAAQFKASETIEWTPNQSKGRSANDFYSRPEEEGTVRVSALFNRLNARFREYQGEGHEKQDMSASFALDRKKNRSVSFNLCVSGHGQRPMSGSQQGPKSILKKPFLEEDSKGRQEPLLSRRDEGERDYRIHIQPMGQDRWEERIKPTPVRPCRGMY